ncbi:prepilin-type N-terminal cleavage/methylation domain-containing protein [Microbacterium esteraromaticum]|uniref:type IV pilus modification PilV family protein n=1 Tax=Microbacterium esteraromaticum TaxID=57043 RepID=UPI0030A08032
MNTRTDDGFSLVEVVIAMFLFMILAVATLPLTVQVISTTAVNRDSLTATAFAKSQLAKIQAAYPATPGSTTSCTTLRAMQSSPPAVDTASGFEATVTVGACPAAFPASVAVHVTVSDHGDPLTSLTTRVRVGAA